MDRRSNSQPRGRRRLPSPALVVASLALLVALAGTGYAAVALEPGSVGTAHLRDGAVTSTKVRNGSLAVVDLAPVARKALRGAVGPAGAKGDAGPRGDAGPKGDAGAPGLSGFEERFASSLFDSSPTKTVVVSCPEGKRLVGGGGGAWGRARIWQAEGVVLTASQAYDARTWLVAAREIVPTEEAWFLQASALCANVQ